MWKLVLAEWKYHRVAVSAAYAIILFLAVSYLLFEGATWQIISTTSSTVLILPLIYLSNSINKEKRYKNALPLPLSLREIGTARLLAPIGFAMVGILIPWLFVLLFAVDRITPTMIGRTLLLAGFLVTISSGIALAADLKHLFRQPRRRLKLVTTLVVLKLLLVMMFMSVYMLQYPKIHRAMNLAALEQQMNSFPGVFIYSSAFVLTGILIFMMDLVVFQRRQTFLE